MQHAEMFVWRVEGYCCFLTYICQNWSHTSIIGIKPTSMTEDSTKYKTTAKTNSASIW